MTPKLPAAGNNYPRRDFIADIIKAAGATALVSLSEAVGATSVSLSGTYTVQQMQDIILKEIPGAPFPSTVDTLKSGQPEQIVTGIVTTMFATVDVIKKAKKLSANFIIAHEPTFYNHTDDVNWVSDNKVVKEKQKLLEQYNITVWRFHDYWHAHQPDGIIYGVLKKAGWLAYYKENQPLLEIPAASVKKIALHLKDKLGIQQLRVIGDLNEIARTVAVLPGAFGGQPQVQLAEQYNPDILIIGETSEWETMEYYRDKIDQGNKKALIILGHSVSEEPGMEWLVDWLSPKVPGLKITHLPSGTPYQWV